jgi:hypothetical protein
MKQSVTKMVEAESGASLAKLATSNMLFGDIMFELSGGSCTCQSFDRAMMMGATRLRRSLAGSFVNAAMNVDYVLPILEEKARQTSVSLSRAVNGAVTALTKEGSGRAMVTYMKDVLLNSPAPSALSTVTVTNIQPSSVSSTQVHSSLEAIVPEIEVALNVAGVKVKVEVVKDNDERDTTESESSSRERETDKDDGADTEAKRSYAGSRQYDESSGEEAAPKEAESSGEAEEVNGAATTVRRPRAVVASLMRAARAVATLDVPLLMAAVFGMALFMGVLCCCFRSKTIIHKVNVSPEEKVRHVDDEAAYGVYQVTPTRPPAGGFWGLGEEGDDQFVVRDGQMVFVSGNRPRSREGPDGVTRHQQHNIDLEKLNALERDLKEELERARARTDVIEPPVVGVPMNGTRREPRGARREPAPQANFNNYTEQEYY